MRSLLLAISLCLLSSPPPLTVLAVSAQSAAPKVLSDAAQYQIYSAVIANFFSDVSGRNASDAIIVSNHTPAPSGKAMSAAQKSIHDRFLITRFEEALQQETLDDYEKNSAAVVSFGPKFAPELHVVLLPDAELSRIVSQSSGGLPPGYGGGILTLSRIGFNPQRTQALVSIDYFCGPFCAADLMFLLVKAGNTWKVLSKIPIFEG